MRHLRVLIALLMSLSLVTGTVASAWAATRVATQMDDGASDADAMPDCHKAAKQQGAGHCASCDAASTCTDALTCLKKCGSQIVGYLIAQWSVALQSTRPDHRSDPPEPPDRVIAPPARPPRA